MLEKINYKQLKETYLMAKIAVIDDSKAVVNLLGNILEEEDHSVLLCTDTDGIEDKVSSFSPDLIFLDVVMPKRNGYAVLRSFKRSDELKDVPVIFTSTKQEPSDVQWGLRQGAVDYITKPFTAERIISAIAQHLSKAD